MLGEHSIEGLVGFTYRTRFGSRQPGNPAAFLREVELRLDSLHISDLRMSSAQAEARLEGADDPEWMVDEYFHRMEYQFVGELLADRERHREAVRSAGAISPVNPCSPSAAKGETV